MGCSPRVPGNAQTGLSGSADAASTCPRVMGHAAHTAALPSRSQRMLVAARSRLIQILEQLASSQGPTDDSSFSAAACLAYLDSSNPTARETLQRCLVLEDRKMKMQVGILSDHAGTTHLSVCLLSLTQSQTGAFP